LGILLLSVTLYAQQTPTSAAVRHVLRPAHEPANLGLLKNELKAYHDCTCQCGCYARALDQQASRAMHALAAQVARSRPGAKLALVLDIDETSLSNYEEMQKEDFGYNSKVFAAWEDEARAPAIPGTLRLYKKAQQLGVAVFFITGRPDTELAATERDLRAAGYSHWAGLTLRRPNQVKEATIAYKSSARAAIVRQGYDILLNVGDQMSDLKGSPQADVSVKLPNPYYYIP
ncbi:MAG: HAD family acid phosphatase, partial [Acidobacteriaceae bacterium]